MAAVLCDTISKIATSFSSGIQKILCFPCEACGYSCNFIKDVFRGDFCLYNSVTFAFNIPPLIFTLVTFFSNDIIMNNNDGNGDCNGILTKWLFLDGTLCLLNILASVYISNQISRAQTTSSSPDDNDNVEEGNSNGGGDYQKTSTDGTPNSTDKNFMGSTATDTSSRGSISRVYQVLCYDPIVAIYILALVFFSIWQSVGISKLVKSNKMFGEACSAIVRKRMVNSITCGYFFLGLGGSALFFSLCCATSRTNFRLR